MFRNYNPVSDIQIQCSSCPPLPSCGNSIYCCAEFKLSSIWYFTVYSSLWSTTPPEQKIKSVLNSIGVEIGVSLSGNTITLNQSHIHVEHYVHKQGELSSPPPKNCSHLISAILPLSDVTVTDGSCLELNLQEETVTSTSRDRLPLLEQRPCERRYTMWVNTLSSPCCAIVLEVLPREISSGHYLVADRLV